MEDIKISIVNDRTAGVKRQRDEAIPKTPCSKRLRSFVVSCSTPSSVSEPFWGSPPTSENDSIKQCNVGTPSHLLEQNPELSDEWDDSILELSDNESDSPLYLTVDEIESLLEDESCCGAESPGLDDTCTYSVSPQSEMEREKVSISPCTHFDKYSTLTEETEHEADLSNYAAMAPSSSHSAKHTVEIAELSTQKSNICIADSVQEKTAPHANFISEIYSESLLHEKEALVCPTASYSSSIAPCIVDVVKWSEDPELSFDCDIDDLLATSPRGGTSSEEEHAAEPDIQCDKQIRTVVSDSATSLHYSKSVHVNQTAPTDCSDTTLVVQVHFPFTPNHSDLLEVNPSSSGVPESIKPQSSSTIVAQRSEHQPKADHFDKKQDVKSSTYSSVVNLTKPLVNPRTKPKSNSLQKAAVSENGHASSSTSSIDQCPVAPVPRPIPRPFISTFELEAKKDMYCDQVLRHIEGPEGAFNFEDPLQELASLLKKISRENQNWQHPSDCSRRNHPRYGKKPPAKRVTLNQWAAKNGGDVQRFKDLPSTFHRSPIPDVLPFSSSKS
ncbi:S100P-binding protein [Gastrophryne carolinensis]